MRHAYPVRPRNEQGWQLGRVAKLRPLRVRRARGQPAERWDEVRPRDELDDAYDEALVEQARRVLASELGLDEAQLVSSVWMRQRIEPTANASVQLNAWHADYYENAWAPLSAILYLPDDGEDDGADDALVGGYTGLVDIPPPPAAADDGRAASQPGLERLPNGTALLREGLMVGPRPGRLVLFSGGGENYHAPLPVSRGRRQSLQMWFECRCAARGRGQLAGGGMTGVPSAAGVG